MDSHFYVWARRQEIEREAARQALLAEAREAATEASAPEEESRSSRTTERLRGLAWGRLSPRRLLSGSA